MKLDRKQLTDNGETPPTGAPGFSRYAKCRDPGCDYSQAGAEEWNRKMVKIYGCRKYYVDEMKPMYVCEGCGRVFCEDHCKIHNGTVQCFGCSWKATATQEPLFSR